MELVKKWEVMPDYLVELQREFKYKTVAVPGPYIGSIPGGAILIWDEKNLEHVLNKNFANYEKGKNVRDILGDFLGNGIFASDGKQWKLHRKVASRMFSRALLRSGTLFMSQDKDAQHYPTPTPQHQQVHRQH